MTRTRARISHDEVVRLIKGVKSCGLPIARVTYDGNRVDVIIGEPENLQLDGPIGHEGLLREPKL